MGSVHTGSKPTYPLKIPVFHHRLVTDDSNALKFQAASSLQLQHGLKYQEAASSSSHLITSPYNQKGHHLDLHTLEPSSQLLAKALTVLKPVRSDYATAEYVESFNWQCVMDALRDLAAAESYEWKQQSFYVVTFRSVLLPTADPDRLTELDSYSHEEATASGGLLKYWFGTKDEQLRNLATCKSKCTFSFCSFIFSLFLSLFLWGTLCRLNILFRVFGSGYGLIRPHQVSGEAERTRDVAD